MHEEGDGGDVGHLVAREQAEAEPQEAVGSDGLDLNVRKLLPQAQPGARVERNKFKRRLQTHLAPGGQPPFGLELACVRTPHLGHPPHRVQAVQYTPPLTTEGSVGHGVIFKARLLVHWEGWVEPESLR